MLLHENSGRGLPYIPRPVREAGGTVHLLVIYNVKCVWVKVLEYYALGHHRVPRCNKSLLIMIMNYQEEYFERNQWELETR